jgi:hypothetical protein
VLGSVEDEQATGFRLGDNVQQEEGEDEDDGTQG